MEWGRTRSQRLERNNRGRQRAKRAARERLEFGLKKLRARIKAWLGLNNCEPEPSRAELTHESRAIFPALAVRKETCNRTSLTLWVVYILE